MPPKRTSADGWVSRPCRRIGCGPNDPIMCGLDYQFDVTATGRVIEILHVVDEFTRDGLEGAEQVDACIRPWEVGFAVQAGSPHHYNAHCRIDRAADARQRRSDGRVSSTERGRLRHVDQDDGRNSSTNRHAA